MPCGTGKSITAYWIAEAAILVAVPSLALVRQSLTDWTREFLAHGIKPDWLCVYSDETVGNLERDEFVGEVYDLGLPKRNRLDKRAGRDGATSHQTHLMINPLRAGRFRRGSVKAPGQGSVFDAPMTCVVCLGISQVVGSMHHD